MNILKNKKLPEEIKLKKSNYDSSRLDSIWSKEIIEKNSVSYVQFFYMHEAYTVRRTVYLYEGPANMIDYLIGYFECPTESILLYINELNYYNDYIKVSLDSSNHIHITLMYCAYGHEFNMDKLLEETRIAEDIIGKLYIDFIKYGLKPLDIGSKLKSNKVKNIAKGFLYGVSILLFIKLLFTNTNIEDNEYSYYEDSNYYENEIEEEPPDYTHLVDEHIDNFIEKYGHDPRTPVYIAPYSGTKFHSGADCPGLENANSIDEITLEEAIEYGYDLCGYESY